MAEQQPAEKQLSRMSLREQLGSRFQSLRSIRSRERRRSQDAPASKDGKSSQHGPTVMSPRSREGAKCIACIGRPSLLVTLAEDSSHAQECWP